MKYGWELTIYFTFYIFPFINQAFTSTLFVVPFLDIFARLGTLNHKLQAFITGYYRWKKKQPVEARDPVFFDYTFFEPLKKAEELFYETGLSASACVKKLNHQMVNVERLARFIAVHIYSVVLGDESLLTNKQLTETLKIDNLTFDEEIMRKECSCLEELKERKLCKNRHDFHDAVWGKPASYPARKREPGAGGVALVCPPRIRAPTSNDREPTASIHLVRAPFQPPAEEAGRKMPSLAAFAGYKIDSDFTPRRACPRGKHNRLRLRKAQFFAKNIKGLRLSPQT